jgi:hypothetical protein
MGRRGVLSEAILFSEVGMADQICVHTPTGVVCYENQTAGSYQVWYRVVGERQNRVPIPSSQRAARESWRKLELLCDALKKIPGPDARKLRLRQWCCVTREHVP